MEPVQIVNEAKAAYVVMKTRWAAMLVHASVAFALGYHLAGQNPGAGLKAMIGYGLLYAAKDIWAFLTHPQTPVAQGGK